MIPYKKIFIKILILISFFQLQTNEKIEKGFIEWKPVDNSNGYKLEIRNDKKLILIEAYTDKNIYFPDLQKGKYEFRIAVLNLFKKPVVYSYWNSLKVIVSRKPILNEKDLSIAQNTNTLLLGNNFLENTKINLLNNGKSYPIQTNLINENKLELITEKLNPGVYDISLINPNQKQTEIKSFLKVLSKEEYKKPEEKIEKVYTSIIDNKDITINSFSNQKADIKIDSSSKDRLSVNIGPKTTEKLDINLQNKSEEKVSVDIENHSKGEIVFNIENKSKEILQMNVNSTSKEMMKININENSKGPVDVKIDEKSKQNISLNNTNNKIDDFDITIENKKKEKLGILIGTAPVIFQPSNEKLPNGYENFSKTEMDTFIKGLKRNCPSNMDVPNILIANCFDDHATLNLTDPDRKRLYNYLLLDSDNYTSRIKAARFFINSCSPNLRFVNEYLAEKLKATVLFFEESEYYKNVLDGFKNCKIPK
jgi:hypothetical protein